MSSSSSDNILPLSSEVFEQGEGLCDPQGELEISSGSAGAIRPVPTSLGDDPTTSRGDLGSLALKTAPVSSQLVDKPRIGEIIPVSKEAKANYSPFVRQALALGNQLKLEESINLEGETLFNFQDYMDSITIGTVLVYVWMVVDGSQIRSIDDDYVEEIAQSIRTKGWMPRMTSPILVAQSLTDASKFLCIEGGYRIKALSKINYTDPILVNVVRSVSVDEMICIGRMLNEAGDSRYRANLISRLELHRRTLNCIVEEMRGAGEEGSESWVSRAFKVTPSLIWQRQDHLGHNMFKNPKTKAHYISLRKTGLQGGAPKEY